MLGKCQRIQSRSYIEKMFETYEKTSWKSCMLRRQAILEVRCQSSKYSLQCIPSQIFKKLLVTLIDNSKVRSMILDGRTSPFFSTVLYMELPNELIVTDNELPD